MNSTAPRRAWSSPAISAASLPKLRDSDTTWTSSASAGKRARDRQRVVAAAVVDIDHFAGEAVACLQRAGEAASRSCSTASPAASLYSGTTIDRPCAAALAAVGRQAGNVRAERHRSGPGEFIRTCICYLHAQLSQR